MCYLQLCLLTWARFVSLVMADSVFQEEEEDHVAESEVLRAVKMAAEKKLEFSDDSDSPSHPHRGHTVTESPSQPPQGHTLTVERSRQWRSETDGRLAVLAHKMAAVLVTGGGWRGRRGVVLWAHCVLGNCHRMLVAMAPTLLEVLLTLSRDDYPQVAGAARLSLVRPLPPHVPHMSHDLISSTHSPGAGLFPACRGGYVYTVLYVQCLNLSLFPSGWGSDCCAGREAVRPGLFPSPSHEAARYI